MVDATPPSPVLQDKKTALPEEVSVETGEIINASGHRDQLRRQYGILSICGMALTVDNAWVAIGTSMNVAICKLPVP
jgi:choline transport protein